MDAENLIVHPETPERFTGIKTGEAPTAAAGMKAVWIAGGHILRAMDPIRGAQIMFRLNQFGGADCPGCAWPDPDDERSALGEYCENGAKAIAEEATTKSIGADFFAKHSIAELSTWTDYELSQKGRLIEPLYKAEGAAHYTSISWDDCFKIIGGHLNKTANPDRALFYTSGRTSNEAAFLYQLFVREFGTNNLPDCSNMCHESSGVALGETLGIGKGSVKLEDFYKTDLIIIIGQNPGTNHPRMLSALEKAKREGVKIISINPLKEAGLTSFKNPQTIKGALGIKAILSDMFLQVKINQDIPLLKAIMVKMLERERAEPGSVFDHHFIQNHTAGYETLLADLEKQDFGSLVAETGLTEAEVSEAAEWVIKSEKIIVCWAMGLTQHKNAVGNIREIVNLLLLKGSIGKPGAGTCPVRGHSNVQGDRTMGIYEKPAQSLLDSIERNFGFRPPQEHGFDVVDGIKAMLDNKIDVFIGMGGNFLSATPDTLRTAQSLQNCKLTAHVSTKLNRSHLITGNEALILPCLGRTDIDLKNGEEQFVTVENSMGVVHISRGNLKPISKLMLSEPEIVCRMAMATLGKKSKIDWEKYLWHYDHIRNDIERTIPGFTDYNKRVRADGGFYLPNGAREGLFNTFDGKAQFSVNPIPQHRLADDELMMMTIRSHDQFNTTIYGLDDRYRGIYNERRVIMMNQKDIDRLGFSAGEVVNLYNYFGGIERIAPKFIIVPYDIPQGNCATYFPETNSLVPLESVAEKSNTPTSKTVVIKIKSAVKEEVASGVEPL